MVGFGIIGFGIFGEKRLIPGFMGSRGTIVGITKQRLEDAKEKASKYDIPSYYDDPADLISDKNVDVIYVASPNFLHARHVILAANKGKPIICEKPLAMNVDEAISIAQACKKNSVQFMIAQCYRYAGSCQEIRKMVNEGVLGEILFISAHYGFQAGNYARKWMFSKKFAGGGPVFDIGVHMVDFVRFLLQEQEIKSFQGNVRYFNQNKFPDRDVESSGSILLRFSSGTTAAVTCSFESPYLTSITIHGTKQSLEAKYFTIVEKDAKIRMFVENNTKVDEKIVNVFNGNFYSKMIDAFIDKIEGRPVSGFPGLKDGIINQIILNRWVGGADRAYIRGILEKTGR